LSNGKALIVGGYGLESLDSVLLYDPNGVASTRRQPADPRLIAAVPLTALLLAIGIALAIPAVRQRLRRWRPGGEPDEWIS
jgi:hypothetical protein